MKKTELERAKKIKIQNCDNKLQMLFNLQKNLQKRLNGVDLPDLCPQHIPMTVTSINAEVGEILEEYQGWKDWKDDVTFDSWNLLYEVVDLWHFIINLTLYLGFDANDVFEAFCKKNQINHERQNSDY